MSALTFEMLSAELTQALAEQRVTPPKTVARCTMGRNKVLVLVEFPPNSAEAETAALQTLNWLEQHLRDRFDTTGVPDEVADSSEEAAEVAVQLYLKHLSEARPFTMHSFTWKVSDGFDDLFDAPAPSSSTAGNTKPASSAVASSVVASSVVADLDTDVDFDLDLATNTGVTGASLGESPDFLADADLGLDLGPSTETGLMPNLSANSEEALEADLSVGITQAKAENSTELSLPGDTPTLDSAELDLPAIDFPVVVPPDNSAGGSDFFELLPSDGVDTSTMSSQNLSSLDIEDANETADEDAPIEDALDLGGPDLGESAPAAPELPNEPELPDEPELASDEAMLDQPVLEENDRENNRALEALDLETTYLESEPPPLDQVASDNLDTENLEAVADANSLAFSDQDEAISGDTLNVFDLAAEAPAATEAESGADDFFAIDSSLDSATAADEVTLYGYEADRSETDDDEYKEDESDDYAADLYTVPPVEEYADDDPAYYLENDADDEDLQDYEDVALVDELEVQRQREQWQEQSRGNPVVIFGAVGFLLLGLVGFITTRPCVVGRCDRIEAARIQGDEAIEALRIDSSFSGVTESKKQLKDAIQSLEPIPPWSAYRNEAQAMLPEYNRQLSALDLVTTAQEKAYRAAVTSQDPPHSMATWQEVADGWRAATTDLNDVPIDSPVRPLAERKLVEYRTNLSTILVRISTESGAEESLRQAQQAASQATQQMSNANTLESLEGILQGWEAAIESLRRIPRGTNAYGEAQQILPEYEEKLLEIRTRVEQERNASRILNNAQRSAAEAQSAEAAGQWTTSVGRWSQAIIQLRQVPAASLENDSAQSLLATYSSALDVAENNMEVALRFQPIEPSFFLVCGVSTVQKCSYSMAAGKVRLDLYEGYDTVINESITPPPQRTGINSDTWLVSQGNQLLQQVALLSTQAQIPVELYDAEGKFLARYRPDLDGFVRQ